MCRTQWTTRTHRDARLDANGMVSTVLLMIVLYAALWYSWIPLRFAGAPATERVAVRDATVLATVNGADVALRVQPQPPGRAVATAASPTAASPVASRAVRLRNHPILCAAIIQ